MQRVIFLATLNFHRIKQNGSNYKHAYSLAVQAAYLLIARNNDYGKIYAQSETRGVYSEYFIFIFSLVILYNRYTHVSVQFIL